SYFLSAWTPPVRPSLFPYTTLFRSWLALFIDPLEGVGTEAILVAGGLRSTAVAHQVGHLVCGLWGAGPEIPLHIRVAQAVLAKTDRKSTRLNSSHVSISYAVSCLTK